MATLTNLISNATGNVGIGTTNPTAKLTIVDNTNGGSINLVGRTNDDTAAINFRANGDASTYAYVAPDTNEFRLYHNDGFMSFYPGGSEKVRITSTGNVGIGTTSPIQKLSIIGATEAGVNTSTTGGPAYYIRYDGANGNYLNSIGAEYSSGNMILGYGATGKASSAGYVSTFANFSGHRSALMVGAGTLEFKNSRTSLSTTVGSDVPMTSSLYINNSGNVGIGTTSPRGKLEINNASDSRLIVYETGTSPYTATLELSSQVLGTYGATVQYTSDAERLTIENYGRTATNSTIGSILFKTKINNTTATDVMIINGFTGNVGIGTTSTDAKLQVYSTTGTTQIFNQLQLTNMGVGNNGDIVGIGFAAGESTQYGVKGSIGFVRTTSYGRGDITFYTNNTAANESVSTSNERMRITSGGSVLIGVNGAYNSSRLLQVKDGLVIGNSFYTFASIDTSGTADLILSSNANPANLGSNSNIIFKLGTSAGGGPDEKMRIVSNGNVGIGTTNPSTILTLSKPIDAAAYGSGSRMIDFKSYYPGYDVDSIKSAIYSGVSDKFTLNTNGGYLAFLVNQSGFSGNSSTNLIEAMRIEKNGAVGIGTSSPAQKLHVVGNVLSSYNILTSVVKISSASDAASYISVDGYTAGLSYAGTYIGLASLVGFGVSANLYIGGGFPIIPTGWSGTISGIAYANATSLATSVLLQTSPDGSTWTTRSQTGAINGTETLTYSVSDSSTPLYVRFTLQQSSGGTVAANNCNIQNIIITNLPSLPNKSSISNRFIVNGDGNVGIGTTAPAYKLEVNGSFAATTKSFKIDHPTKEGKKLIYGSLESPYHGIRLTGRNTLVNGKYKVQLPDYVCKLVRVESVNVQLTGIKCGKTLYIDDINIPENYFVVAYDKTVFESYKTYDFFWDFTAIRADVPELQTEM
jgi:hypothetical protein